MSSAELHRTNPNTGELEELCTVCLKSLEGVIDLSKLPYHEDIVEYSDCCSALARCVATRMRGVLLPNAYHILREYYGSKDG